MISLCMAIKDEVANLEELLPLVSPYVAEIVVIDTGNSDGTARVLDLFGAHRLPVALEDNFSKVRNIGLEAVTQPWVLMLDADERPSKKMMEWLRDWVEGEPHSRIDGLLLWRENRVDGQLIPLKPLEMHLRLFRQDRFRYKGRLHERPVKMSGGRPVYMIVPPPLHIEHDKSAERQRRTNAFYKEMAERIGDERLMRIQSGPDVDDNDRPIPPQMWMAQPLKLNVGGGGLRYKGFLNLDLNINAEPDVICDLREGLPFPDGVADEVIAEHVLEHFSYHWAGWMLTDWIRVLKVGGEITIKVPDFDWICQSFVNQELGYLRAIQLLYGGQTKMSFDTHLNSLNEGWFRGQFHWHGCEEITRRHDLHASHYLNRPDEEVVMTAKRGTAPLRRPERPKWGI